MAVVTPEQAAAAAKRAVLELGGAFGHDPKTMRKARQLGLTGWAFYVAGRAGALGDVRPDTAAAAMAFIASEAVKDGWEAARRIAPPPEIAAHNLSECCRWGRENLESFYGLPQFVELAERRAAERDEARRRSAELKRARAAAHRELLAARTELSEAEAARVAAERAVTAAKRRVEKATAAVNALDE